jgi:hypothetical protein
VKSSPRARKIEQPISQHRSPNASSSPAPNPSRTGTAHHETTNLPHARPPRRAPNRTKPQIYRSQPQQPKRRGGGKHTENSRRKNARADGTDPDREGPELTRADLTRAEAGKKIRPKKLTRKSKGSHLSQAARREVGDGERGERERRLLSLVFFLLPRPGSLACGVRARRVAGPSGHL